MISKLLSSENTLVMKKSGGFVGKDRSIDKFALITGASSGIGKAFAIKLAEQGYDLILTARRQKLLDELANSLNDQYNIQTIVLVADLSQQEGIDLVVEELKNHDNLNILINNAGFTTSGNFEDIPWDKHSKMISVHMIAATQLAYASIPIMKKNNEGIIINVASISAFISRGNLYGPTKAYLVSLTKNLKTIFKGSNVIVQALCPGFTYSGFHKTEEYKGRDPYSEIPKFAWMTSEKVVDISLKAIKKKKTVVITGLRYKIIIRLVNWGLLQKPKPKIIK